MSEVLLKRETIEREQFVELLAGQSEEEVFGRDETPVPVPPPARPRRPSGPASAARRRCRGQGWPAGPLRCGPILLLLFGPAHCPGR